MSKKGCETIPPRHRCRGRCKSQRIIGKIPMATDYMPWGMGSGPQETTVIVFEEIEALRLVDLEELTQEEAASKMGVSRKTLWKDLQLARKKLVSALINGHAIRIEGGSYILKEEETTCQEKTEQGPYGQTETEE